MKHATTTKTTLGELTEALVKIAEEDGQTAAEVYGAAAVALVRTLLRADRADLLSELENLAVEVEPQESSTEKRRAGSDATVAA